MSISSKEARETNYWLRPLRDSNLCEGIDYPELIRESEEIIAILTSIVKTTQKNNSQFLMFNFKFKAKNSKLLLSMTMRLIQARSESYKYE